MNDNNIINSEGAYRTGSGWCTGAGDGHEPAYGAPGAPQDDGRDAQDLRQLRDQHGELLRANTGPASRSEQPWSVWGSHRRRLITFKLQSV